MRFNHLKINGFGKLNKKDIELKPGINIILGENEAGKSTILKFITAMLYGASKNKNGKSITDFDKYKPWNDSEFSGSLEYTLDNGEIFEIYREFKKKNPTIYDSEKNDITKNFKESKSKGIAFFEEQTAISEDTYLSTAVVQQEEVKLDKSSQNSIIQKISNKVSSGDDNISYKNTLAKLNKLQGEKIGTDRTQNRPINIVNSEIKRLEAKKKELEEIKNSGVNDNSELERFKKKIQEKEQEKDEKLKKLSENNETKESANANYIVPIIIGIIAVILLVCLSNKFIGLAILLIAIIYSVIILLKQKKNKALAKEIQEKTIQKLTIDIKENEEIIEKMKKNLYEIEFCKKADDKLLEELPEIVQRLEDLYEEQKELETLNNSYNIAKECLENAYEEMKKNIGPQFIENLCKTISVISNEKYNFVKVTDDEGLIVGLENGSYINADRLSIGTIDQMYLSLRLSAIKEFSNENMPIILDEVFAYFDNERLANVLEYLGSKYKDNQILIFTCSNREKDILDENNIEYNLINLEK